MVGEHLQIDGFIVHNQYVVVFRPLDTHLSQLDPAGAHALLDTLRGLARAGVAVLLVEHRLEACWDHCDEVVVMEAGRIVDRARPAQVGPGHPLLHTMRRLGLQIPGALDLRDPSLTVDTAPPPPSSPHCSRARRSARRCTRR